MCVYILGGMSVRHSGVNLTTTKSIEKGKRTRTDAQRETKIIIIIQLTFVR